MIFSATICGDFAGTSSPTLSLKNSDTAPTSVAITDVLTIIASAIVSPKPSKSCVIESNKSNCSIILKDDPGK